MNLNQACWLGGPARSGKSTIAKDIAKKSGIISYHVDDYFGNVMMKNIIINREKNPNLYIMQNEDENFVTQLQLKEYIDIVFGVHRELFDFVKNDIINLSTSDKVIIEGLSLLPDILNENGISNACYLLSSHDFFEEKTIFWDKVKTQDEKDNISSMMEAMRNHIEEKANFYGFKIIPVNNEHTLEINTKLVSEHFSL